MITSVFILAALAALSPAGGDTGHDGPLRAACVECHTRLPFSIGAPSLRDDVGDVCGRCHELHQGAGPMRFHLVNPGPGMRIPRDMILDGKGRIACITCHAFHGEYRDEAGKKRFYLRRTPGRTFCYSCHEKLR